MSKVSIVTHCKIRGLRFAIYQNEDKQFCVGQPGEFTEWHWSESTAKNWMREDIDRARKLYDALPDLGEPDLRLQREATVAIYDDMEPYSEWGVKEHCKWIAEVHDLDATQLRVAVFSGCFLLTTESCSYVIALPYNHMDAPCKFIAKETD